MKYALLVSRTLKNGTDTGWKNIGDYIQSLAAEQFLPKVDEYYDKTSDDTGTDDIKMIMNAWYIWEPEKFPLAKRIIPLPVSMHISPFCAKELLSIDKVLSWFKIHEPIGCRDKETETLLQEKGVKTYFSACLTLTLGKKYKYQGERKGIIFVDPYLSSIKGELSILDILSTIFFSLRHIKTYCNILKKFNHHYCRGRFIALKKLIYSSIFVKTYSGMFSLKELSEAEFFTHMIKVGDGTNLNKEEEKMDYAKKLVQRYASSSIVVTGRIHCALPCLGIETPVIFTTGYTIEEGSKSFSAGRFGGLIDLFNIAKINKLNTISEFSLPIKNKDLYKSYANELQKKCEDFIND